MLTACVIFKAVSSRAKLIGDGLADGFDGKASPSCSFPVGASCRIRDRSVKKKRSNSQVNNSWLKLGVVIVTIGFNHAKGLQRPKVKESERIQAPSCMVLGRVHDGFWLSLLCGLSSRGFGVCCLSHWTLSAAWLLKSSPCCRCATSIGPIPMSCDEGLQTTVGIQSLLPALQVYE